MKVYLDDKRIPFSGWVLVKTAKGAIRLLKKGEVEEISLDHDLGDELVTGTGYDVVKWIEEQVHINNFKPPKIMTVHSDNGPARIRMELAIRSIYEFAERRDNGTN